MHNEHNRNNYLDGIFYSSHNLFLVLNSKEKRISRHCFCLYNRPDLRLNGIKCDKSTLNCKQRILCVEVVKNEGRLKFTSSMIFLISAVASCAADHPPNLCSAILKV